ncbi:MAG: hypothetical protein CMJ23_09965 [Phycisphaerae bacterium]|nr:hypothetical protein [Phycisphaerae bacterium]
MWWLVGIVAGIRNRHRRSAGRRVRAIGFEGRAGGIPGLDRAELGSRLPVMSRRNRARDQPVGGDERFL